MSAMEQAGEHVHEARAEIVAGRIEPEVADVHAAMAQAHALLAIAFLLGQLVEHMAPVTTIQAPEPPRNMFGPVKP